MNIGDWLDRSAIAPRVNAAGKRQALAAVADLAVRSFGAEIGDAEAVLEALLERELEGSTGVGHGVAIPHGKLNSISSIKGVFARLANPVDFEALDDEPVDLVFLLLAPEGAGADHLKALSRIARVLRDQELVNKLRQTDSASAIYAFLNEEQASNAA